MPSNLNSFDQSQLKAFIQSQLGARGFGGAVAGALFDIYFPNGNDSGSGVFDETEARIFSNRKFENRMMAEFFNFTNSTTHEFNFIVYNGDLVCVHTNNFWSGIFYFETSTGNWENVTPQGADQNNWSVSPATRAIPEEIIGKPLIQDGDLVIVTDSSAYRYDLASIKTPSTSYVSVLDDNYDETSGLFTVPGHTFSNGDVVWLWQWADILSNNRSTGGTSSLFVVDNVSGDDFNLYLGDVLFSDSKDNNLVEWRIGLANDNWSPIFVDCLSVQDAKVGGTEVYVATQNAQSIITDFVTWTETDLTATDTFKGMISFDSSNVVSFYGTNAGLDPIYNGGRANIYIDDTNRPTLYGVRDANDLVNFNFRCWSWNGSAWVDVSNGFGMPLLSFDYIGLTGNLLCELVQSTLYAFIQTPKRIVEINLTTGVQTQLATSNVYGFATRNGKLLILFQSNFTDDNTNVGRVIEYDPSDGSLIRLEGAEVNPVLDGNGTVGPSAGGLRKIKVLNQQFSNYLPGSGWKVIPDVVISNKDTYPWNQTYTNGTVFTLSAGLTDTDNAAFTGVVWSTSPTVPPAPANILGAGLTLNYTPPNDDQTRIYAIIQRKDNNSTIFDDIYVSVGTAIGAPVINNPVADAVLDSSNFDIDWTLIDPTDGDISASAVWRLLDKNPLDKTNNQVAFLGVGSGFTGLNVSASITPGVNYWISVTKSNSQGHQAIQFVRVSFT